MKKQILYRRNPHQREYHDDIKSKFLHLSGGYGSGKSFGLVHKLFRLSRLNKNLPGGLVCPSYTDFKRDVHELIDQICTENKIKYIYHKGEHWYLFPWSTAKCYVATAEKPLKGPNWSYACINELTLMPFDRFSEVIARVRLKKATYPQIASCGTPEGLLTGYYGFFIEKPTERTRIIYGNTMDNLANLSPDYIDSLRAAYDEKTLEAYMKGQFINTLGGRFYYAYDEKSQDKTVEENKEYDVMMSLDFNVAPMVATIWQWGNGGALYAVNEIIVKDNANTNDFCDVMKARGYTPERTTIYPDPAGNARSTKGQPDIQILRNHGYYNIKVRSQAPPFRKRQLNVCNLFEKRRLRVNPNRATYLHRDLLLCTQDRETLEKEKSSPELTHASDGMDYMCDLEFPFSGARPQSSVISIR